MGESTEGSLKDGELQIEETIKAEAGETKEENPNTLDVHTLQLIERFGKELGVSIDPKTATEEQRLDLAMKLSEEHAWQAMEIVTGQKLTVKDVQYCLAYIRYKKGEITKEEFLEGCKRSLRVASGSDEYLLLTVGLSMRLSMQDALEKMKRI
jgi:hypothetical protein